MATVPLFPDSVQVNLNGSGAGTAQLGPTGHGQVWTVNSISVRTAQTVSTGTCQCLVYVGDRASAENFLDGTFSGDTGDVFDTPVTLKLNQSVFAVWSSGVASDIATLAITGTSEQRL